MSEADYDVLLDPYHFAGHCEMALTPQEIQAGLRYGQKNHKRVFREEVFGRISQSQEL